jgi:PhnB protein
MAFKPKGYSSVSPYLIVNDAQPAINSLDTVFNARPLRKYPGEAGKLEHGEIRIADSALMLCDAVDGWPLVPAQVRI